MIRLLFESPSTKCGEGSTGFPESEILDAPNVPNHGSSLRGPLLLDPQGEGQTFGTSLDPEKGSNPLAVEQSRDHIEMPLEVEREL